MFGSLCEGDNTNSLNKKILIEGNGSVKGEVQEVKVAT